jgi:hypothetical protein
MDARVVSVTSTCGGEIIAAKASKINTGDTVAKIRSVAHPAVVGADSVVLRTVGFTSPVLFADAFVELVHVCVFSAFEAVVDGMTGTFVDLTRRVAT